MAMCTCFETLFRCAYDCTDAAIKLMHVPVPRRSMNFDISMITIDAAHLTVILINVILLIFSKKIVSFFHLGTGNGFQLMLFRLVNVLFILSQLIDYGISLFTSDYKNALGSLGYTLLTIYLGAFSFSMFSYIVRRKFGREKEIDGGTHYIDTYNSRLIDIFLIIIIGASVFYVIINIWGVTSLLETTGFIGILIAFLALTHSIWAPDPYYCMVILGSEMIEDGDTIKLDNLQHEYIIARVTFVYTILYDVQNNYRVMMRNSKLIESKIENLSKRTSYDGLRYSIRYKIGYADVISGTSEERKKELASYFKRIDTMFTAAQERATADPKCLTNANMPFEWLIENTGDYAIEYTLIYYLEALPNTKLTKTIRTYLYQTRAFINRYVYEASVEQGLSLSTPDLLSLQNPVRCDEAVSV